MPDIPVILHETSAYVFDTDDPALSSIRYPLLYGVRLPPEVGQAAFFFKSQWVSDQRFKISGGYSAGLDSIYFEGFYTVQTWCPGDPLPSGHDEPTMLSLTFNKMVLPTDVRTCVDTSRSEIPETWLEDSWHMDWHESRSQNRIFTFTDDVEPIRSMPGIPVWLYRGAAVSVIMAGLTDGFHQTATNRETNQQYQETFGVALNPPAERNIIPDVPLGEHLTERDDPRPQPTMEEEDPETSECVQCGDEVVTRNVHWVGDDPHCENCFFTNYATCERCGEPESRQWVCSVYVNTRYRTEIWCEGCTDWSAIMCEGCGDVFSADHVSMNENSYGEAMCPNCYEDYEDDWCDCDECRYERGEVPDLVREWDYVPELVFHGRTDPMSTGPFFGMEIETAWPRQYLSDTELVRWAKDENLEKSDVIWIKRDSSVANGFEIVTHPMTFEWAMENFPWGSFDKLIDKYNALETDPSCGGHVHINKDSFSRSHLWKFIQFHVRMGDWCELMGGRDATQWGAVKGALADEIKKNAKSIAMTKRQRSQPRYQGLNFLPDNTVELRYPAGGSSAYLIKKNLQLAHSIWTFTKETDVKLYQTGILDDAGYFLWWIEEKAETYPELVKYIRSIIVQPKAIVKEDI